ncbi:hypothetical protein, partial [Acinetobacter baumannii]|uniref:hypothetical protein n=1 Tax=Acinetobacter baumannii TaxID=470 RepID=UPI0024B6C0F3
AWKSASVDGAGSGVSAIGSIDGGSYSANGASIVGNSIFLQTASVSQVGLVDVGAQTFNGVKTFDDGLAVTAGGAAITGNSTIAGTLGSLTG